MSTSVRVIKNTIYLYGKSVISMVVMLFVTRIVLQTLGVIDYGIYNVVAGSIAILGFFRNSLATTMQRYLNHYQGENNFRKQKQVFNIGVVFHWVVALALVVLFAGFAYFLFNGILNIPEERVTAAEWVYVCLIINTFLTVVTAPYEATITAHENMLFYSVVGIVESAMKLAVALAIMHTVGDKLVVYAILMMIIPFFETMMMRIYCKRKYAECIFHPKKEWDAPLAKDMLRFAGWSLVGSSTNIVSNQGANLALNHFFGAAINAVAGIANQIQGALAVLLKGLLKSLTPVVFKTEGTGDVKNMLRISMLGCKYSTLLFAFLAVPVFVYTPFLLRIWLVEVPEWSVLFVRLQLIRAFIEQLYGSMKYSLNATNNVKELNILSSIFNLAPVVILILLYSIGAQPYWHYIVMIVVMVLGTCVAVLYLCMKYCHLQISDYLKMVLWPCLITSGVACIVGYSATILKNDWLGLAVCVIISSLSFVLFSWLLMHKDERGLFKPIIKKVKSRL